MRCTKERRVNSSDLSSKATKTQLHVNTRRDITDKKEHLKRDTIKLKREKQHSEREREM